MGEIIDLGVNYEIIKKSGSWFSYGDTKLGQGRDAVKALLEDNIELMEELETKIMDTVKAIE
jgi:recombination protein RecA